MVRLVAALLASALALPLTLAAGPARADELAMKAKLQQVESKVVIRLEVTPEARARYKKKRTKAKVNVYAGKTEDGVKRLKSYYWAFDKDVRKWSFDQQELCKKGHTHLRLKVKIKTKGGEQDELKRTLDLDC